jgi:putative transcriptional regulator
LNKGKEEEVSLNTAATHILEECRMVLPGIQALFGFQLIAVFSQGFSEKLSEAQQQLHLAAIVLVVIAIALVMAPAAIHRQTSQRAAALLCLFLAAPAAAQPLEPPNGVLLVAKPSLADPNFREAVVLVTQSRDSSTVGVILNRPTTLSARELLPETPGVESYEEPVYFGGPVMRQTVVALFRSRSVPPASAFHILKGVYLSMHPANIEPLLSRPGQRYRLYAGFAGWAPRQLESELERDSWYLLPASEALVFRKDTRGMWSELIEKARGGRAQNQEP